MTATPLDPEPYIAANGHFRTDLSGDNFTFAPRDEYEQDPAAYERETAPESDLRTLTWDEAGRQAYAAAYAERSGISILELRLNGRVALPCHCGDEICEGWQMGYAGDFDDWLTGTERLDSDRG